MFVSLSDLNVHVRVSGSVGAPALLLLHSLGTSNTIWDGVAEILSREYRIIQPDMRGHGLTTVTPGPYTIEGLAQDVLAIMDAVGIEKTHIAGVSIGGLIAQQVALAAPQRLHSMVLIDTAPVFPSSESWQERAATVRRSGLRGMADTVMDRWITPVAKDTPDGRGLRQAFLRTDPEGYAGACEALSSCDLTVPLSRVTIPGLVIVGEDDLATPVAVSETLARSLVNASMVTLPGLRHIPMVEKPGDLAAIMAEFLKKSSGSLLADDLYAAGMQVRRAVLGDAHVDRSSANITSFDQAFVQFITRTAWGQVWSRSHFDRRTRSIVTLALLAGLGCEEEFALHVRASRNTGCTEEDIAEALLHVAVYAGIPRANSAMHRAKEILSKLNA